MDIIQFIIYGIVGILLSLAIWFSIIAVKTKAEHRNIRTYQRFVFLMFVVLVGISIYTLYLAQNTFIVRIYS